MIVVRRRLIFWLIKAYVKKSGKTILFSFLAGLLILFGFAFLSQHVGKFVPLQRKTNIGLVGAFTQDNLPAAVVDKIGQGLTVVASDGSIKPGIATSWKIQDNGKKYVFYLRKNTFFNDGTPVTSDKISYNFSDATIGRPDRYSIIFTLKDSYAPFLATVSRPIIKRLIRMCRTKNFDLRLRTRCLICILSEKKHTFPIHQDRRTTIPMCRLK